jgi:hypothetical protein
MTTGSDGSDGGQWQAEDLERATARELIVELARTEEALRASAGAGAQTEALAAREHAIVEALRRRHGLGFRERVAAPVPAEDAEAGLG